MTKSSTTQFEVANTLTHGLGLIGSIAGGAALITFAALTRDPFKIVGSSIFTATLIVLYSASTFYHAAPAGLWKTRLRRFDHCAIYLLIAGSYTPVTLIGLRGPWGWSLFGVVWALACAGVVFKLLYTGRFKLVSTALYLAMGWLALVAIVPLVTLLAPVTLAWLVAGGVIYTLGTFFYHNERVPQAHAIWHIFVLLGSLCHAVAVGTQL